MSFPEANFLLNSSLVIALISICALFFVPVKLKSGITIAAVFLNVLATSFVAITSLTGNTIDLLFCAGNLWGEIPIKIDGLSAWFILIINFTSLTGIIYGNGYLKAYNETSAKLSMHYIWFVLFHLSMLWVCMIQHGFAFLIAWEIMSLSSMLLILFDQGNPKTLKAAMNYFVQMHISVVLLTLGFLWVYTETGSLTLDAMGSFFSTHDNKWLFLLLFAGFGLKAGFVPFHSWLPHAHPAAPSHISGVMSGVIVKMGIYGIIRTISFLQSDFILLGEILIVVSLFTGLYGILFAAVHRDFKKMLAYCTIENIGIIGIGLGLGLIGLGNNSPMLSLLGFGGALLHTLNHSLFKSLLFYAAGSVYQQTHTRNIEKLGGLIKKMPRTAIIFLIGAIAIGGIPPFNGFVSEFIIYSGILEGIKSNSLGQISLFALTLAGLSLIGGISILAFTKSFSTIFLGVEREKLSHQPHEVSSNMLLPQYIIIGIMLSISFFPQFYLSAINSILSGLFLSSFSIPQNSLLSYTNSISAISICAALFMVLILVVWGIRSRVVKNKPVEIGPTWGCGYVAPNTRMQYTGKSFSKPLSKVFNYLLLEKKQYHELEPNEIFPEKRSYASVYNDFLEHQIIGKITNRIVFSSGYFKFIQNGRTQTYVLYGILFIVVFLALTFLNII